MAGQSNWLFQNIFSRYTYPIVIVGALVTAILTILMPVFAAVFVLFIISLVLFGRRSGALFYFVLALAPIDRFYFPLTYKLKAYQIVLLCALAFEFASAAVYKKRPRISWNILDTAILAIYVCKILSFFVSVDHVVYFKSILLNGFFVLLYYYVRIKSEMLGAERVIRFMLYTSTLFILFGFFEFLLGKAGVGTLQIAKEIHIYVGRPCSVFKEPDWFGGYLTFIIGLTLPFVDSELSRDKAGALYRPIFYIALMMSLLIVVRSAWLGLGVCLPFLIIYKKISFKTLTVIVFKIGGVMALLLIVLLMTSPSLYESIRDRFFSMISSVGYGQHDSAALVRLNSYEIILGYIKSNPIKGYGTGAWEFLSQKYQHINPALSTNNILLTPVFEMGIAGIAAGLFYAIALIKLIRDGFRYSVIGIENRYAVGIAISVVSSFVVAIFNDITLTGFYWAFIAVFSSYVAGLKKTHENIAYS